MTSSSRSSGSSSIVSGFEVAEMVKNLPAMQETRVQSLGGENPLGKGNGYLLQCSCLENSRIEESGGLQSMGLP